jgi:hypothetical protein
MAAGERKIDSIAKTIEKTFIELESSIRTGVRVKSGAR